MLDSTTTPHDAPAAVARDIDAGVMTGGAKGPYEGLAAAAQSGQKDAENFVSTNFGNLSIGDSHPVGDAASGLKGSDLQVAKSGNNAEDPVPEYPGFPTKLPDSLPDVRGLAPMGERPIGPPNSGNQPGQDGRPIPGTEEISPGRLPAHNTEGRPGAGMTPPDATTGNSIEGRPGAGMTPPEVTTGNKTGAGPIIWDLHKIEGGIGPAAPGAAEPLPG